MLKLKSKGWVLEAVFVKLREFSFRILRMLLGSYFKGFRFAKGWHVSHFEDLMCLMVLALKQRVSVGFPHEQVSCSGRNWSSVEVIYQIIVSTLETV